jgi:tripartite-type tricarboxylate transporter receptor subunit TctC
MRFIPALAAAALVAIAPRAPSHADEYPSKPIKLIVAVAPGGSTDVMARLFADHITRRTGQPVVVENRTGAAGVIGSDAVAKAAPDGYTLGLNNTSQIVLNPFLQKNMPLDPLSDLVPVAPLADAPQVLVIDARIPAKTLQEFIAYARANPGKLNYASLGPGSTPHLGGDQFARIGKVDIVPIQYRGATPAITDILAGNVQMMSVGFAPTAGFVQNGSLRALAVGAPKRLHYAPDVPTATEAGMPGYEMSTWFGVFAPRGTPKPIVEQLNQYARELLADPATLKRLSDGFIDPMSMTTEEFAAFVKSEAQKWERIIRQSGLAAR